MVTICGLNPKAPLKCIGVDFRIGEKKKLNHGKRRMSKKIKYIERERNNKRNGVQKVIHGIQSKFRMIVSPLYISMDKMSRS